MPNPDAEALIATQLDKLPDPDDTGRHFMFIDYTRFPGQHEEHQQLIDANKDRTARALVLMLENHGKAIVDLADIATPPTIGDSPIVGLYCATCGSTLGQTIEPISNDGKLRVPATLIAHECL